MSSKLPESKHFDLIQLTEGVYAAIHKWGGAAYCNAGVIDLGNQTLVVDTFDVPFAANDLKTAAEKLTGRSVETVIITHPHGDHWGGNQVFGEDTTILAQTTVEKELKEAAKESLAWKENLSEFREWMESIKTRLETEEDPRWRLNLERSIKRGQYGLKALKLFEPRSIDQSFEEQVKFEGNKRIAELIHKGMVHSSSDSVLLLPEDGIAFLGDIGFFSQQPFMGYCDLDNWQNTLLEFIESEYQIFVPGHGSIGNKQDLTLMLRYFDVLEELVSEIIETGGSEEDATKLELPTPFDDWLMGGMMRFEANVKYMYQRLKERE